MKHQPITKESFDGLLRWLDPDRERAGLRYEYIRKSLVKIFTAKGLIGAEELADETINRVALRLPELVHDYKGDPTRYFHGVARNVSFERRKAKPTAVSLDDPGLDIKSVPAEAKPDIEELYSEFEDCLHQLSERHRHILLQYYATDHDKSAYRKQLAVQLGIHPTALRKRVERLRTALRSCLEQKHIMRIKGNIVF